MRMIIAEEDDIAKGTVRICDEAENTLAEVKLPGEGFILAVHPDDCEDLTKGLMAAARAMAAGITPRS